MNHTKIEWVKNPDGTQGYTWNPITGCLNGCSYCYARKLANTRLKERYLVNENVSPRSSVDVGGLLYPFINAGPATIHRTDDFTNPFHPRFWPDRLLDIPFTKKPLGIFTCDMSDLFGIGIPEWWTEQVFKTINTYPQHRFYLLTKQPQNLAKFSPFPDNCWVGVTATDNQMFQDACWRLRFIKATIKYISFEPLLGKPFKDNYNLSPEFILRDAGINWIIIGSQTKPYKPPMIEWVQEIVEAADKAKIPVFLKDNLYPHIYKGAGGKRQEMPKEGKCY